MGTPLRVAALLLVSVAATAAGPAAGAGADDGPPSWLVDHVRFEPLDGEGAHLAVDGLNAYRGTIELRAAGGGVAVVNEVDLEAYVRGIAEVPPSWPEEALRAQAIAARTYALNQMASTVTTSWREAGAHLCATDACQVYAGMAVEEQEGGAAWVAAVESTAGQALLIDGQPIRAEYSSSNGGRSVAAGVSYLRAVNDPDDAYSPQNHWNYTVPVGLFADAAGVDDPGTLVGLARSGDVIVCTVKPPDGEPAEHTVGVGDFVAAANSRLAAPGGLPLPFPSLRFTLTSEDGSATVDGRGWGHGRGMSQWGAYGKARRGWEAADILAAYYGGVRPEMLTPEVRASPVRVALATGRRSAGVTAGRPFRVVGDEGQVLAPVAVGRWTASSEKGRLRVRPPEGFGEPISITGAAITPSRLVAGSPPTLRFTVSAPAAVTVRLHGPGVDSESLSQLMVEAGEATFRLPRPRYGGDYRVTIEADSGAGRPTTTHLRVGVQGQSVYVASVRAPRESRPAWTALAFLLAAGAATAAVAVASRDA